MASSASWKLRRIASRVIRVVKRRGAEHPAVGAFGSTIVPKAQTFIKAYDDAGRYESTYRKELREGKNAVGVVLQGIRMWLPLVQRDVPGFDGSSYGDQPDVPDDIIEDGSRLFDVVHDFVDAENKPLEYRNAFLADFEPKLKAAEKEWPEAEAADSAYQGKLRDVRDAGEAFDQELQGFRKTIAAAFGRSDKDYQKLRAEKAHTPDEEDDPAGPSAPGPVEPAGPGVNRPTS